MHILQVQCYSVMVFLAYGDLLNMNPLKKKFQNHTYIHNRNLDDEYFMKNSDDGFFKMSTIHYDL